MPKIDYQPVPGPLKWHGGKAYLARRIVALMPPHVHYVEPYFGGGSVLLTKNPHGVSEVVNDINHGLTNFWKVLQDPTTFTSFQRQVEAVPFSEVEWKEAGHETSSRVTQAVQFFIRCRQSLAGRMKAFSGVTKTRTRRNMNNEVSAWLSAVEGLPEVHTRLKRVLILDARPALEVIQSQDGPGTLFYLDPPYLHETRTAADVYDHEMTRDQHLELLETLATIEGKFLLSGYWSLPYGTAARTHGWKVCEFNIANHAAGGKIKRRMVELVWANF